MGDKILQKTYTLDFLHKTPIKNEGQVPMYHIEQDHEAIIPPETFKRVQDEILRRKNRPIQGQTIFSGKIFCGCCGATFGPKVWHSNPSGDFTAASPAYLAAKSYFDASPAPDRQAHKAMPVHIALCLAGSVESLVINIDVTM